jgi:hypothetical protein
MIIQKDTIDRLRALGVKARQLEMLQKVASSLTIDEQDWGGFFRESPGSCRDIVLGCERIFEALRVNPPPAEFRRPPTEHWPTMMQEKLKDDPVFDKLFRQTLDHLLYDRPLHGRFRGSAGKPDPDPPEPIGSGGGGGDEPAEWQKKLWGDKPWGKR